MKPAPPFFINSQDCYKTHISDLAEVARQNWKYINAPRKGISAMKSDDL